MVNDNYPNLCHSFDLSVGDIMAEVKTGVQCRKMKDRIKSKNTIPKPTYDQCQHGILIGKKSKCVLVMKEDQETDVGTDEEFFTIYPDLDWQKETIFDARLIRVLSSIWLTEEYQNRMALVERFLINGGYNTQSAIETGVKLTASSIVLSGIDSGGSDSKISESYEIVDPHEVEDERIRLVDIYNCIIVVVADL